MNSNMPNMVPGQVADQALDFDDIFDIWEPAWWENPLLWLGIGAGVLILAALMYYGLRYWRSRHDQQSPREKALKRLYALNPIVGLNSQHEYKKFYVEIFSIIKQYVAQRYGYAVYGLTDHEFILAARDTLQLPSFYSVAQKVLERGVTIKFASKNGVLEQIKQDYSSVLELFSQETEQAPSGL